MTSTLQVGFRLKRPGLGGIEHLRSTALLESDYRGDAVFAVFEGRHRGILSQIGPNRRGFMR